MIIKFIKKNFIACLALFLALSVFVTGSISFARYASSVDINGGAGAASFSCSTSIDSVSALSFTNTAFWGGTAGDDKIAMNALRTIDFSINNYQVDGEGNKTVADVRLKYNLVFEAPVNFTERLAIQVFDKEDKPMLPQIVLSDLMNSVIGANDEGAFDTGDSEDYNGTHYPSDVHFEVTKTPGGEHHNYSAISVSEGISINLTSFMRTVHQRLEFRTWDCSALTSAEKPQMDTEGGTLAPPLSVIYKEDIEFYRISISLPDFNLPAGIETSEKYSIRLAPTDTIQDEHLGGNFVNKISDNGTPNDTSDDTYAPVTSIYGDSETPIRWYLETVHEKQTDAYFSDEGMNTPIEVDGHDKVLVTEYNVMGSPKHYNPGDEISSNPITIQSVKNVNGTDWKTTSTSTTYKGLTDINTLKRSSDDVTVTENPNWATNNNDNYVGRSNSKVSVTIGGKSRDRYIYVYKEAVNLQLEETVEETIIEERTRKTDGSITENTEITESGRVISSDDEKIVIHLTKESKTTKDNTSKEVTETTTTTTSYKRTVTGTGYVLTGYYYNTGGKNDEYPPNADYHARYTGNATIRIGETTLNITNNAEIQWENITENKVADGDPDVDIKTSEKPIAQEVLPPTVEYITRTIERTFNHTEILVEEVAWRGIGKPDDAPKEIYTQLKPLNLFESDIQKVFLSQCYSKNYPFFVNVLFEQVLD